MHTAQGAIQTVAAALPASLIAPTGAAAFLLVFLAFLLPSLAWLAALRRRRAERSWKRMEEIVSSIQPDTLLVISPDRVVRACNESVLRMFGYAPVEVIGRRTDLLYADRRSDRTCPGEISGAMAREGYHVGFAEGRRKTGEAVPLEIITAPLRGGRGAVLVVRDISDRLSAADERRRVEARMRQHQKVESLGVLATGLGREFEALLERIERHLSEGAGAVAPESAAGRHLSKIGAAKEHAAGLCRELRTYAGGGEGEFAEFDLPSVVLEIGRLLEVSISRKAVLQFRLPPGLPTVRGDVAQIRQVIMNLIVNASDSLGGARGMIGLACGVRDFGTGELAAASVGADLGPGRYVFAEVSDTGCGMDGATLARIFDPFFTTKARGRGLGLASVTGIIRRHGGALLVSSAPGAGTRFTVLLPAAGAAARGEAPDRGLALVADDDRAVRMEAGRLLAGMGYTVVAVPGGTQALETFRERASEVSVVLMDAPVPSYGVKDAVAGIAAAGTAARVVLMSSHDEESVAREYAAAGFSAIVQKPLSEARVREVFPGDH